MPRGIVSNRDKLFTSQFWMDFCLLLETIQRLSTAYHPQTDGQTKHTNQFLLGWLRNYFAGSTDLWSRKLRQAEFCYNNQKHNTIGMSPFEALYGYNPRMVEYLRHRDTKSLG